MANVIDVSQFADEVGTIISRYSKNISNETEKWLQDTAKKTAKRVRAKAPKNAPSDYRSGIKAVKRDGKWVVYASKKTGLAHLMEHSHPIIAHGVVVKQHSANTPHWKPAEEEIQNDIRELESKLSKVGAE